MDDKKRNLKTIFIESLEIENPQECSTYLDKACAGDKKLRKQVEELLRAVGKVDSFLSASAIEALCSEVDTFVEKPGKANDQYSEIADQLRAAFENPDILRKAQDLFLSNSIGQPASKLDNEEPYKSAQESSDCPERIGKYRIFSLLEEGGQAHVYRAMHDRLEKELIIKISKKAVDKNPDLRAEIVAGGKLLASLDHPALARVYDLDIHNGRPFLAMEYIRGQNLVQYMRGKKLKSQEAALLVARIAQALHAAHACGVIHLDIKPQNIMIDESEKPRIIDFGLARVQSVWKTDSIPPGAIAGTTTFLPPESARGENDEVDRRSDIFALGAVLYWLLVGNAPYAKNNKLEALEAAQKCDFDRNALLKLRISSRIKNICLKAMAAKKENRYATARELAEDLERYARTRFRPLWFKVAMGVLSTVIVIGLFAILQKDPDQVRENQNATLNGSMKILIWENQNMGSTLQGIDREAVKPGDQFRVDAHCTRPAYMYLLWIGCSGEVTPIFPWNGKWENQPLDEIPLETLQLPQSAADVSWIIPPGKSGMETLLFLTREEPLSSEIDLKGLLTNLPRLELEEPRGAFEFDNWQLEVRERGKLDTFDVRRIHDPVLRMNQVLKERLSEHFCYSYSVIFANHGK